MPSKPSARAKAVKRTGAKKSSTRPTPSGALVLTEQKKAQAKIVERAVGDAQPTESKQPRFNPADPQKFLRLVRKWIELAQELKEPEYKSDSRTRDTFLSRVWMLEPHLAGVLNATTSLDKNRGFSLVGGRNQVNRYLGVLHAFQAAPGQVGWRSGVGVSALQYRSTDLGALVELGREGEGGPLRALYACDSTKFYLTGNLESPLAYAPSIGKPQFWSDQDYLRAVDMPQGGEELNGLGFCAVSRALELSKLMIAVYRHDQEQLGARMPKGLMLLDGISETEWQNALNSREQDLDGMARQYFGGLMVLAGNGLQEANARLVALSNLPAGFDLEKTTNLLMYGYALIFNYSPREFWPVSAGTLGTATETETQDENSTSKGESDFILEFQEQLQSPNVLPATLHFEFDERDAKGDLALAEIKEAKINIIKGLYESSEGGVPGNRPLLTYDEARQLLAQDGIIPEEWTQIEEDVTATDQEAARTRVWREKFREHERVLRAVERFPAEPIVRYHWPSGMQVTLWDNRDEMLRRRVYPVAKVLAELKRVRSKRFASLELD